MNTVVGGIAALVVGGGLAAATVFGLVSAQTGAPDKSPASSSNPVVDYGSTP